MNETIRILIVDDERPFRDTSERLLTRAGYEVITAKNGQMALDMLAKSAVDIMVLDLKMPVMAGEEVLKITRSLYPDIPVIVVTGHGTMDSVLECMKKGAYDYITKPFQPDQLLLSINMAVDKRHLEQKARRYQDKFVKNFFDLNAEKKRLETIINCMANGVIVTNRNMEVVLHNPAFMRLMEKSLPRHWDNR